MGYLPKKVEGIAVPGVSLIDEKFVMVRGLSQRYNNVWINGGAAPRAFSFDLIPSSQIDNLTIVKVPSAEYPADYSGGFIIIGTTEVPEKNSFNLSVGGNFNDRSFKDFISTNARHTPLPGGMDAALAGWGGGIVGLLSNSLDNDWTMRKFNPISDLKLSGALSRRWNLPAGGRFGLNAAVNFSKEYRAYRGMQNNLFGAYDYQNGKSVYLRNSTDDQYNDNGRLGAMLNLTWLSADGNNKIQLKNIFNRIDNNRYTYREGVYAWNGSNDVSREWTALREHIASLAFNDKQEFDLFSATADLKAGIYGEYRTRRYANREFIYHWNANDNTLPAGFKYMDIQELLSDESYMGEDRIHLLEKTDRRNDYRGNNLLGAAYLSASIPLGRLSILAGLRFEHNDMELISNTSRLVESPMSRHYISGELFPSVSATYRFEPGSKEEDRPMQGQSPYLINGGVFYDNEDIALDIALLYNRIGKRIIGVGRSEGTSGGEDVVKVPDSYEMPRNSLDLTVSKKFGRHLDVKLYAKNLLGEMVYYKQFEGNVEQVTRAYDPGRNIGIQLVYTL